MEKIAVYTITNLLDGKQYVGISGELEVRWRAHRKADGYCPVLHAAIKKHGVENFLFEHIADAFSWESACMIEASLIQQLQTKAPYGYNLTKGGDGTKGYKHTEAECKRRSIEAPTRNPEVAKKVGDSLRGKPKFNTRGEKNAMFNRTGFKSHMLTGVIVATNIETGEQKTLAGAKEIEAAGFIRSHVYQCALGSRKTHSKHTFVRISI